MRSKRIRILIGRSFLQKINFSEKKKLERRQQRLQITQKMPANDKEDTPKIQHMRKSCLQRGKPNYETIKPTKNN